MNSEPWATRRCLGSLWALPGRCLKAALGAVWALSVRCPGSLWALSGRGQNAVWAPSGVALRAVWALPVRCLGSLWALSGVAVGAVWAGCALFLGYGPQRERGPGCITRPKRSLEARELCAAESAWSEGRDVMPSSKSR